MKKVKIYRVLNKEEYEYLLENNSLILKENKYFDKDLFLFNRSDSFKNGKYFFFVLEEAINFAMGASWCDFKDKIIEVDIDESMILPNLAYGVYRYGDYNMDGCYEDACPHYVAELLLPYNLIEEKIKNKEYRIIEHKERYGYYCSFKYYKSKHCVALGYILYDLKMCEKKIKDLIKDNNSDPHELEKEYANLKKYHKVFKKIYNRFLKEHKDYSFEKINSVR